MPLSRRSVLAALGATLPIGLGTHLQGAELLSEESLTLRFLPFEEAVRRAFLDLDHNSKSAENPCRRIEIGHSDLVRSGLPGCQNDRAFAGFPAGHLRIVRVGSEPGPAHRGIRLYVTTVDIALTGGPTPGIPSRSLDFTTLPPVPVLV